MCDQLKKFTSENFDDIDTPLLYVRKFDEYGIKIIDGGNSSITILFCPWCGKHLPESKRDRWFDELEKAGIDPWTEKIPEKYQTDEWYK